MADTALHLVEQVIPEVAVRQWVCSLPWRLRVLCGYDKRLCADVLEACTPRLRRSVDLRGLRPLRFVVELSRSYKRRAKKSLGLDSASRCAHRRRERDALRFAPWTSVDFVHSGSTRGLCAPT